MKPCLVCAKPTGHPTATRCSNCQKLWERGRRARHPQRQAYESHGYRAYREWVRAARPLCALCGQPGADSVDHDRPLLAGGSNRPGNLQPAHLACNVRKHGRGPDVQG